MVWESPSKPWDLCSPERQEMLRVAWAAGDLRWKLDPSQKLIWDAILASHATVKSSAQRMFCMDVSRQSGKDFIMACLAISTAIKSQRQIRIPYAAPTRTTVHDLLVPTIEAIFQDCPPDLLPHEIAKGTFRTNTKTITWPGLKTIVLVGVDLHPDWLRGPATGAFFFTEPAFVENMKGLMEGVLLPMMLTRPDGFGVLGSTPPETPGHPWSTKYIPEAKKRGMYAKRTIMDCPRFDPDQVKGMIEEMGGLKATRVRRELFCEHIVEENLAVVPEFSDAKATIVTSEGFDKPPRLRDTYVSLDPGWEHATGGVFGYLDFHTGLFMIEGDFAVPHKNSSEVARLVRAREWQLWGLTPRKPRKMTDEAWKEELDLCRKEFYPDLPQAAAPVMSYRDQQIKPGPLKRVSDTESRLISDMSNEHGLVILPTEKDDSSSAINALRIKIQDLKFRIHPRCINLITHLEQGIWNKSRTKIAISADGTHFDCIPAMVYLNRNISWTRNPFPPVAYDRYTHHVPPSKSGGELSKLFRTGRSARGKVGS